MNGQAAGAAAVDSGSELDEVNSILIRNQGITHELITLVESIGDKVLGCIPPSPSTDKDVADDPDNSMQRLRQSALSQRTALEQLRDQIQRLEAL